MKQLLPAGQTRLQIHGFVCALLLGFASCVTLPRQSFISPGQTAPSSLRESATVSKLTNINLASPEELERLPGIGRGLAVRIVAHRNRYGRFRRTEHIMTVRGISDRKFRALRSLINAE